MKQRLNEMGYPTKELDGALEVVDVNGDKVLLETA